jgi:hypothetical protein
MANHLAAVLSRGIERLAQGQTVDEYLGHVDARTLPQRERRELQALLALSARLLSLRHAPIPTPMARAANRARFLSKAVQLKESLHPPMVRPRGPFLRLLRRGLARTVVSVALLLVVGRGAVGAAEASLPGMPLYPLKLTVEEAQLGLAASAHQRALLYVRFANERTDEMLRLTALGQVPSPALVARLERQLLGALQSAGEAEAEQRRELLAELIDATDSQQETLGHALDSAAPDAHAALQAGVGTAARTGQQAHDALGDVIPPTATPTPVAADTATSSPTPSQPVAVPVDSPTARPTETAVSRETPYTATTTLARTPSPSAEQSPTRTPSRTAGKPVTPGVKPSVTLSLEPTPTASAAASPVSPTPTATYVPPTATATQRPTDTPAARFRLTNDDNPDPVPASYRIHYVVCVVNEGNVTLTNVTLTDKWSPRECLYYLPFNPPQLSWELGTVDAGQQECVHFSLNTYSICGGRTAVNEASMSCDQGSASAVQRTHISGTPTPTLTPTITTTVTPTLTLTPTHILTPTSTATDAPTLTATWTLTATETLDATATTTSTLTSTSKGTPTTSSPAR